MSSGYQPIEDYGVIDAGVCRSALAQSLQSDELDHRVRRRHLSSVQPMPFREGTAYQGAEQPTTYRTPDCKEADIVG